MKHHTVNAADLSHTHIGKYFYFAPILPNGNLAQPNYYKLTHYENKQPTDWRDQPLGDPVTILHTATGPSRWFYPDDVLSFTTEPPEPAPEQEALF